MEIILGYIPLEITICKSCGQLYHKGHFIPKDDYKKAFLGIAQRHVILAEGSGHLEADTSWLDRPVKNMQIGIAVQMGLDFDKKTIPAKLMYTECPQCSRIKGGYFEGVLQLRNEENDAFSAVSDVIEHSADNNSKVAVTKKLKVDGGVDYYFTDQRFMCQIASQLHRKHGGEYKTSAKLHGLDRMSSKKTYRVNALLKLPEQNIGDIVRSYEELYKITSTAGNRIKAESLITRKQRPIPPDFELIARKAACHDAIVTQKKPHIEILHPQNFESIRIENPPQEAGKKIKVVFVDEKAYAV